MAPIIPGAFRSCGIAAKSRVDFSLSTPESDSTTHIYRTDNEIQGEVLFTPSRDTILQNVRISFEGVAGICIWDRNMTTVETEKPTVKQSFIRLYQPIDEPCVSEGTVLKAGDTQSFQFLFVVPRESLPQACRHSHAHPEVKCQHLHLPPSFGAGTWMEKQGRFSARLDPDTASVVYNIVFSATEIDPSSHLPIGDVAKVHRITILPSFNEMPPLLASKSNKTGRRLSKDVTIRRLDRKKIGRLTVNAKQPSAIQLGQNPKIPLQPSPTILPINLEFRPTGNSTSLPVPKVVRSRLKAATYFGVEPWDYLPDRAEQDVAHPSHYVFRQGVSLPPRNITSVSWEDQYSRSKKQPTRTHDAELPAYDEGGEDTPVYTASISLPVSLPDKVVYSPTFFSCLISRAYYLKVDIYFEVHPKLPLTSMVSLTIPIQIASAGGSGTTT